MPRPTVVALPIAMMVVSTLLQLCIRDRRWAGQARITLSVLGFFCLLAAIFGLLLAGKYLFLPLLLGAAVVWGIAVRRTVESLRQPHQDSGAQEDLE